MTDRSAWWRVALLVAASVVSFCATAPAAAADAQASVSLTSDSIFAIPGTTLNYVAHVAAPDGSPAPSGGSVEFTDGGADVSGCSSVPIDGSGDATCSVTFARADLGDHSIVANYSGDPNYASSLSAPLTIGVYNTSSVFSSSASPYTWTVPSGITSVGVDARGSAGGTGASLGLDGLLNPSCQSTPGGKGGSAQAALTASAGDVWQINAGAPDTNGGAAGTYHGGAGGGASDVRSGAFGLADRLLVAGGGGGGGAFDDCTATGSPYGVAYGGGGGYPAGGQAAYPFGVAGSGGFGGTQSDGGSGGGSDALEVVSPSSSPGSLGQGGIGAGYVFLGGGGGGGGGGGYYGGGGGGLSLRVVSEFPYVTGWGGGGGSSSGPPGAVFADGVNSGEGRVTLFFDGLSSTTSTVGASATTPAPGDSVTFTDTLDYQPTSVASVMPSGTVDFSANGSPIAGCQRVSVVDGAASCTTSFATSDDYTIKASYSGDDRFAASSGTTAVTVTQPPSFTSDDKATFTVGSSQTPTFTVNTSPGLPSQTSLSESGALPSGVTFTDNGDGSATLQGTPDAGTGGVYPITLTATAGATTASATQSFTLTVDEAPSITSPDKYTLPTGASADFFITTSGYPLPHLSEGGALPPGVTFADNNDGTAAFYGSTPVGNNGSYPITITVDNGIGSPVEQSFTLTVIQIPAFIDGRSTTRYGVPGAYVSYTFGTTYAPGQVPGIGWVYGAGIAGLTVTDNGDGTATIAGTLPQTWNPGGPRGGTYTLEATNAVGVGFIVITIDSGVAPAITSSNAASWTVGTSNTFIVTSSGTPTPSLSEQGQLPKGLSFTDNGDGTATITGTPAAGTVASYPLTITASNGAAPDVTQPFTLNVIKAAQTISFSSTPPSPALFGGTYTPAASGGASGNAVAFTIDPSSAPGACWILGGVVSFIGPGLCVIDANQVGDSDYNAASQKQQSFTIGFTKTLTGKVGSSLIVASGQAVYLSPGTAISGSVTVQAGGALAAQGATISGQLSSSGASEIRLCATKVRSTVVVTKTAGLIVAGDDDGPVACAGNAESASVSMTGNLGGVEFDANQVSGSLTITGNTGTLPAPDSGTVDVVENKVSGKLSIQP